MFIGIQYIRSLCINFASVGPLVYKWFTNKDTKTTCKPCILISQQRVSWYRENWGSHITYNTVMNTSGFTIWTGTYLVMLIIQFNKSGKACFKQLQKTRAFEEFIWYSHMRHFDTLHSGTCVHREYTRCKQPINPINAIVIDRVITS